MLDKLLITSWTDIVPCCFIRKCLALWKASFIASGSTNGILKGFVERLLGCIRVVEELLYYFYMNMRFVIFEIWLNCLLFFVVGFSSGGDLAIRHRVRMESNEGFLYCRCLKKACRCYWGVTKGAPILYRWCEFRYSCSAQWILNCGPSLGSSPGAGSEGAPESFKFTHGVSTRWIPIWEWIPVPLVFEHLFLDGSGLNKGFLY